MSALQDLADNPLPEDPAPAPNNTAIASGAYFQGLAQQGRDAEAAAQNDARQQRSVLQQLADRSIPSYVDETGAKPVTDESGAPLTNYDKKNSLAWDSQGNPRSISYDSATGAPQLKDPFEGKPEVTDPADGSKYKIAPGLPWQYTGQDPEIAKQAQQDARDRAISTASTALGRQLSQDEHLSTAGESDYKFNAKQLSQTVPTLAGVDDLTSPDATAALHEHFDQQLQSPEANSHDGWFSWSPNPAAMKFRQGVEDQRQSALAKLQALQAQRGQLDATNDRINQQRQVASAMDATLAQHAMQKIPGLSAIPGLEQPGDGAGSAGPQAADTQASQAPQQGSSGNGAPSQFQTAGGPSGADSQPKAYSVAQDGQVQVDPVHPFDAINAAEKDGVAKFTPEEHSAAQLMQTRIQAISAARAGQKPYALDDQNNFKNSQDKPLDGLTTAVQDGIISQPPPEVMRDAGIMQEARAKAGDASSYAKAAASGAVPGLVGGAGFAGGAIGGKVAGGAIGSWIGRLIGGIGGAAVPIAGETGASEVGGAALGSVAGRSVGSWIGGVIGGLLAGKLTSDAATKALKAAGNVNDFIASVNAAGEVHSTVKGAADFAGMLATGDLPQVLQGKPGALRSIAQLTSAAYSQGGALGAAQVVGSKALQGAAGGAAFELGIRPAFDHLVNAAETVLGIPHDEAVQSPTMGSVLQTAALGAILGFHDTEISTHSPQDIMGIMARAKVRNEAGFGLTEQIDPKTFADALSKQGINPDSQSFGSWAQPLSENEAALHSALASKAAALAKSGLFDDAAGIRFGPVTQATTKIFNPAERKFERQSYFNTDIKPIEKGESGEPPVQPIAGAPEGAPEGTPGGPIPQPNSAGPGSENQVPAEKPVTGREVPPGETSSPQPTAEQSGKGPSQESQNQSQVVPPGGPSAPQEQPPSPDTSSQAQPSASAPSIVPADTRQSQQVPTEGRIPGLSPQAGDTGASVSSSETPATQEGKSAPSTPEAPQPVSATPTSVQPAEASKNASSEQPQAGTSPVEKGSTSPASTTAPAEGNPRKWKDLPDPTPAQATLMDDRSAIRYPAKSNSKVYVRSGPVGHEWLSTVSGKVAGSGFEASVQAAKEAGLKSVAEFSKQPAKPNEPAAKPETSPLSQSKPETTPQAGQAPAASAPEAAKSASPTGKPVGGPSDSGVNTSGGDGAGGRGGSAGDVAPAKTATATAVKEPSGAPSSDVKKGVRSGAEIRTLTWPEGSVHVEFPDEASHEAYKSDPDYQAQVQEAARQGVAKGKISVRVPRPKPEPITREHSDRILNDTLEASKSDLEKAGVGKGRIIHDSDRTGPSGLSYVVRASSGKRGELHVNAEKFNKHLNDIQTAQHEQGIAGTPEEAARAALGEEATHAAQDRVAESKGKTLPEFYKEFPDEEMPEGWEKNGEEARPGWKDMPKWQKRAEFTRMVLQGKWIGTISEAFYRHLQQVLKFLKQIASGSKASEAFKEHLAEVEKAMGGLKVEAKPTDHEEPAVPEVKVTSSKNAAETPAASEIPAVEVLNSEKRVKVTAPKGASFIRAIDSKGRPVIEPISNVGKGANPFHGAGPFSKVEAGTMGGKGGKEFIPTAGETKIEPQLKPSLGAAPVSDGGEHFKNDMFAQAAWLNKKALTSGKKFSELPEKTALALEQKWRQLYPDARAASAAYPIPEAFLNRNSFSAGLHGSEDALRSQQAYEERSGKKATAASIDAFRAAAEPLVKASEAAGRVFSPKLLDLVGAQGGEHQVTFTPGRVLKFTEPDTAGGVVKFDDEGKPGVFHGTLPEYLKQIEENREYSGDDMRVEGIMRHPDGAISIVSSQKAMNGVDPSPEEIAKAMSGTGFVPVQMERALGQEGNEAWWNPETGDAVMDGKPANFVKGDKGDIQAIDIKAFHPEGKALEWIREHSEAKTKSNEPETTTLDAAATDLRKPLRDELDSVWPGLTDRESETAMTEPFSPSLRAKYEALDPQKQSAVDQWFDKNEGQLNKYSDAKEAQTTSGTLSRHAEDGDAAQFGQVLLDKLQDIWRGGLKNRNEAAVDLFEQAGQIARAHDLDPAQIKAAVQNELIRHYGSDAPEMTKALFGALAKAVQPTLGATTPKPNAGVQKIADKLSLHYDRDAEGHHFLDPKTGARFTLAKPESVGQVQSAMNRANNFGIPKKAAPKTYDEAQKRIDAIEDRLEKQGVNVGLLADPSEKGSAILLDNPSSGWKPMPPDLAEAYRQREEIGKTDLETNVNDIKGELSKIGMTGPEAMAVLKHYSLDKTDAFGQSMAAEHAEKAAHRSLEHQAEELAYTLSAQRGEMVDELRDVSSRTLRDAAKAAKIVASYFGNSAADNPTLAAPSASDYNEEAGKMQRSGPATSPIEPTAEERRRIKQAFADVDRSSIHPTSGWSHPIADVLERAGMPLTDASKGKVVWMAQHGDIEMLSHGDWSLSDARNRAWAVKPDGGASNDTRMLMKMAQSEPDRLDAAATGGTLGAANPAPANMNAKLKPLHDILHADTDDLKPRDYSTPLGPPPKPIKPGIKGAIEQIQSPGQFTPYKAIINRVSMIQQRTGMAGRAAVSEAGKLIPPPARRAAIGAFIESQIEAEKTGETRDQVLDRWAATNQRKEYQAKYNAAKNLTPLEKEVAATLEESYEQSKALAQEWGILPEEVNGQPWEGRAHYIGRYWDKRSVDTRSAILASGRLKTSASFQKARHFDTAFEGEQPFVDPTGQTVPGLTHLTDDPFETWGIHNMELNKVISQRMAVAEMSRVPAVDGRPLVAPTGVVSRVNDEDGNPKVYLSYPAAKMKVMNQISGEKEPAFDYRGIDNQHLLQSWRYKAEDADGNPIMMQSALAVHPEIRDHLNNWTGTSKLRQWMNSPGTPLENIPKHILKGVETAQGIAKEAMFAFSGFHYVTLAEHAAEHRINPLGHLAHSIADVARGLLGATLSAPMIDHTDPAVIDAMSHGLMLGPDTVSAASFMEGVGGTGKLGRIPIVGRGARVISHDLFHRFLPNIKWELYTAMVKRLTHSLSKELANGSVTPDDVKYTAARYTNTALSHQNYIDLGRNPTLQHILGSTLLAPDFSETRAKFVGQAASFLAGNKSAFEQFSAIALGAGILYCVCRVLNHLLDGDPHFEAKNAFKIIHGDRAYEVRSVQGDIIKLLSDKNQFVQGRVSPIAKFALEQGVTGTNYRGEKIGLKDSLGELLGSFVPISMREIPGIRTLLGHLTDTSKNTPVSPMEQFASAMGIHTSRYSPISETYQRAKLFKVSQGQPVDTGSYPVSKYQMLRYALEDGDMTRAQGELSKLSAIVPPDKLARGFHESVMKPFSGSKADEADFVRSLDPRGKALYRLAVQDRAKIMNRFSLIRQPDASAALATR